MSRSYYDLMIGTVHAKGIHRSQQLLRRQGTPTVARLANVGMRVENAESVSHEIGRTLFLRRGEH